MTREDAKKENITFGNFPTQSTGELIPYLNEDKKNKLIDKIFDIVERECQWRDNSEGVYDTSCGNSFLTIDGSAKECGFKYCVYCGGKINV